MRSSLSWIVACAALAFTPGCGDDKKPQVPDELPTEPQLLLNSVGFVVFPLIAADGSTTFHLSIRNGGENALEISSIAVAGTGFSLDGPATYSIESRDSADVQVHFDPAARGVYLGSLTLSSNAANVTSPVTLELIGPASRKPLPSEPDIQPFEATAEVTTVAEGKRAFARYMNLGGGMLNVTKYVLANNSGGAFALASAAQPGTGCATWNCTGVLPAACTSGKAGPIHVGSGSFVAFPVSFTGSAAATATFQITSNDPDTCVEEIELHGQ